MHKTLWKILCPILLVVMVIAEVVAVWLLLRLDMLPPLYLVIVFAAMLAIDGLIALLMFLPGKKSGNLRRGIACGVALLLTVGACVGANALNKVLETMEKVTENTVVTDVIGFYALAGNENATMENVGSLKFAVTEIYDWENTQRTISELSAEKGVALQTVTYANVFTAINALYAGEADAMILNTAYISILESLEPYADFEQKTKLIYEHSIKEIIQVESKPPVQTTRPSQSGATIPSVTDPTGTIPSGTGSIPTDPGQTGPGYTQPPYTRPTFDRPSPTEPANQWGLRPFILYLSGSDTRSTVLRTSRSDVNILAVVNPDSKQILLINTPRDYYIPNPAVGGGLDKLTHCGIYGMDCSIQALEDLYGVQVDHYAQINFTGFEMLVDAVGGVTIYSDYAFTTLHGKFQVKKGYNDFNGYQAVCFARERYALPSGDYDRGRNQMKLITAIAKKMASGAVITNYAQILDSMEGTFVTSVSQNMISDFVKMQLSDMSQWNILSYTVSGRGAMRETASMPGFSASVQIPVMSTVYHAAYLMERVLYGEVLTEADLKP